MELTKRNKNKKTKNETPQKFVEMLKIWTKYVTYQRNFRPTFKLMRTAYKSFAYFG